MTLASVNHKATIVSPPPKKKKKKKNVENRDEGHFVLGFPIQLLLRIEALNPKTLNP